MSKPPLKFPTKSTDIVTQRNNSEIFNQNHEIRIRGFGVLGFWGFGVLECWVVWMSVQSMRLLSEIRFLHFLFDGVSR